ncbi:MAG TPA: AAA family ATPase [Candidatus Binatia bacterium]|jgi:DNA-binding winged helix-turn-helix (wHTH) protein/tetratricopeptide (TPR) repeat protein
MSDARVERDRWIRFGRFALDTANARLHRGQEVVALRGKTLALLEYLALRPGLLVTKDELLARLWPDVYVSEDVLVGCVRELRIAFGDTRGAPRYIETVYRRGYRWVAAAMEEDAADAAPTADLRRPAVALVGRDAEVAQLGRWFERAAAGARQVVFVTGDTGIGKTALVDGFVRAVAGEAAVAFGQCREQYGPSEPFLPILDALERSLPEGLLTPSGGNAPPQLASGLMPERAVRLLGSAVEGLAGERPLVLVLEDLHWSDPSTLDVLSYLAHRREPCRLFVVATYRPTELILRRHPLRGLEQELRTHHYSVQLPIGRLTQDSVARWLAAKCPSPPAALVEWLYRRTEGQPLFLTTLFESLLSAGLVGCHDGAWQIAPGYIDLGVPESLRLMIDRQVEDLGEADRQLLEAASVAGTHFSAASVAAAVVRELEEVEEGCDALARDGQFLRATGLAEWPDGTVSGAYEFIHELHRGTLYARLSPAHLRLLHQRVGCRLERGYGVRADVIATELAQHFERGRDAARATKYLEQAATQYIWRGAHREAITTLRRALEMVRSFPDTPERVDRLIYLDLRLGASLLVGEDYADHAVKATFQRCAELAERAKALPPLLTALAGLHAYHAARAELGDALRIVPRLIELADMLPLPQATLVAHTCAAWSNWSRGRLAAAREHARRALVAKPETPMPFPSTFDLVGYAFGTGAFAEMTRGDLAAARALSAQGLAWSRETARPVDRATALALAAMLHAFMNEPALAAEQAAEAVAVAEEHGHRQWRATARVVAAWAAALAKPGTKALAAIVEQIDAYTTLGLRAQLSPMLCLAAEAHAAGERKREALELLARAETHVRESGEEWYVAELYRLQGEIAHVRDPRAAQAAFERALATARTQGARLWELRAAASLAALWGRQRKRAAAREALDPVLGAFPADLDAPDLVAARALRARLV